MLSAEDIIACIIPSFPAEDEPFARAYQAQEMEAACTAAASLCLERRISLIRDLITAGAESESYRIEQKMRTERRVDSARLAEELPAVYAACVYIDAADAKRLLGGAKGLYAAAAAAAPERIRDFERVSLAELDALLSPAEQRRFITAEARPLGHPFLIRRDAA